MSNLYAIGDLHLDKASKKDIARFCDFLFWDLEDDDKLIICGDTTDLVQYDKIMKMAGDRHIEKRVMFVPGNSDPVEKQTKKIVRQYEDLGTVVIGCKGTNWEATPWAKHHLHDQPSDPRDMLDWIDKEIASIDKTWDVILAIHFPLCYQQLDRLTASAGTVISRNIQEYFHPGFIGLLARHDNIKHVIHGHVHRGCGELPSGVGGTTISNVSADRINYIPKLITHA